MWESLRLLHNSTKMIPLQQTKILIGKILEIYEIFMTSYFELTQRSLAKWVSFYCQFFATQIIGCAKELVVLL